MARKKKQDQPERKGILIERDEIVQDLRRVTGLVIRGGSTQSGINLHYGFARVTLGHSPFFTTATGRREGDLGRNETHTHEIVSYGELVEWCADILKTGRTLECGQGAGLPNPRDLWPAFQPCDYPLDDLLDYLDGSPERNRAPWNLNPDYQRGHVWTQSQAEKFVGHFLEGGQTPLIFIQRYESPKNAPRGTNYWELPEEVVDGQQRLRALRSWLKGEIPAELTDGRKVWYKDTDERERAGFPFVKIAFIDVDRTTQLRFYLRLNRGGTVHTDEEIQHVRDLLAEEEFKWPWPIN